MGEPTTPTAHLHLAADGTVTPARFDTGPARPARPYAVGIEDPAWWRPRVTRLAFHPTPGTGRRRTG